MNETGKFIAGSIVAMTAYYLCAKLLGLQGDALHAGLIFAPIFYAAIRYGIGKY